MTPRQSQLIPFFVGVAVAAVLWFTVGWWGFWLVFPWIGGWISVGNLVSQGRKGRARDRGRRIAILMGIPVFIIFIGVQQRESLQLEEAVFYLAAGSFTRVLVHYAVAKVFGPLIWGRGFCGWACWTAGVLDWLPIRDNRPVAHGHTHLRYLVLAASLGLPLVLILLGYDYRRHHIDENLDKAHQLYWMLGSNGLYYAAAVGLAFALRKKRAFCRVLCPVALVMKPATRLALLKRRPSDKACNECGVCNKLCPMDIDIMGPILRHEAIRSTECTYCGLCKHVCPTGAIA